MPSIHARLSWQQNLLPWCLQMGLGKTVELLACVLAHPFTPTDHVVPIKSEPGSNKVGVIVAMNSCHMPSWQTITVHA